MQVTVENKFYELTRQTSVALPKPFVAVPGVEPKRPCDYLNPVAELISIDRSKLR